MAIAVRRITQHEGETLAEVRLRALANSPSAFARTHEEESLFLPVRWAALAVERSAGRDHCTFFAHDGDLVVGLVGGHRDTGNAEIELVSMWVDPDVRGRGVGAVLVGAIVGWAGSDPVNLWVTEGNDAARRLYERCGFVVTGEIAPLPSNLDLEEIRMRL